MKKSKEKKSIDEAPPKFGKSGLPTKIPSFLKGQRFSSKTTLPKFNPSQFRIQHKGG